MATPFTGEARDGGGGHVVERRPSATSRPTSPALEAVVDQALLLAPHTATNLLILGETGVGKEWLARAIHDASRRRGGFVAVNVGALSTELLSSELMGSRRGAFTGAVDRAGSVVEAEGGTLFLDEIGELGVANQVSLLRFLQNRCVTPVGGSGERAVDVRVIAASNRPLRAMVENGGFRADLLHRFPPPLRMPPLRERREEILAHARECLAEAVRDAGAPRPRLTDRAREFLLHYSWPGNVRELRLVMAHAIVLSRGEAITSKLLGTLCAAQPAAGSAARGGAPEPTDWPRFRASRDETEAAWLRQRLAAHAGNVNLTARAIGCPATTLRNLIRKHGFDRP